MNFPDMARFFDDLSHVLQTGGMRSIIYQSGGGVVDVLKSILSLILISIALYIGYHMIFGGYPRFLINILTLNFYRKDNIEGFLRENALFISSFQTLQFAASGCENPFAAFDEIYGGDSGSRLNHTINNMQSVISALYPNLKPDDQFYEALINYYLYYDKAGKDVCETVDILKQDGEAVNDKIIRNKEFYQQMLGYRISKNMYDSKNKSDDVKLIEMHDLDKGQQLFNSYVTLKNSIDEVAAIIRQMTDRLRDNPYSSFVLLPENKLDHQAFAADYQKYFEDIQSGEIYNASVDTINDYSWVLIEYIQWRNNNGVFGKFSSEFSGLRFNGKERATIKKYLNVPLEQKRLAESRIFHRDLQRKKPKQIDPDRSAFKEKERKYPEHERTTNDFLDFINKHPIFAHVIFNDKIADKAGFYNNVMRMYNRFCTSCNSSNDFTNNLINNGYQFKRMTNCAFILDLYVGLDDFDKLQIEKKCEKDKNKVKQLNQDIRDAKKRRIRYKFELMRNYQDQNYDNAKFFEKLWRPYYVDYIINRIGSEFKRTFSKRTWMDSYVKFLVKWQLLGKMIKDVMKLLWNAFKRGTNVSPPKPEPV